MTLTSFNIATQAVKFVCSRYHLEPRDLDGPSRQRRCVWPRQLAIHLIRRNTSMSLPDIGVLFNRHHSDILHSLSAVENRVASDCRAAREVAGLVGEFEASLAPKLSPLAAALAEQAA